MNRTVLGAIAVFAGGLFTGVAGGHAHAAARQAPQPLARTMLLTVPLPDLPGKEARMWITELAPGIATPRHSHPGHVLGYVLDGAIENRVDGKVPHGLGPGSAWSELPNEVHVGANTSATARARLLAVGIFDKGAPLSNPAP